MFPSHDEKVRIINEVIKDGGYGEEILEALKEYSNQFVWKCGNYCPFTIRRGRWHPPGFPTTEARRQHRERDHEEHGLTIERTLLGNPRYVCDCGEMHFLNETELERWETGENVECSERMAHLERVRNESTI